MVLPPSALYINQEVKSTMQSRKYPHSPIEAGMARCANPTYVSYTGDGSGRDSYIILNNGGLTNSPKRNMMWTTKLQSLKSTRRSPHKGAVGF